MLKILVKNQFYSIFSSFFKNNKNRKRRSNIGTALLIALYALLMLFLFSVFFGMAYILSPLLNVELSWFYFSISFGVALLLGVLGSVFNTYSSLYNSKDNDLLLSMPIPVKYILLARLSTVYLLGLMYSSIVALPSIIMFYIFGKISIISVFTPLITFVLLTMIVFCLSCGLGYVVAKITTKLKNKSFITVVVSLVFFGAYYFFFAKSSSFITAIVNSGVEISSNVKSFAYPIYMMGSAAAGNLIHLIIFITAITIITIGVYKLLEKSFLKIIIFHQTHSSTRKKEKNYNQKPISISLLSREFKRFISSATYMLNCGLGILASLLLAVIVAIKRNSLYEISALLIPYLGDVASILAILITAVASSMTYTAAASVSLEGKTISIIHSLPVSAWQVLKAKMLTQIILALPTTIILSISLTLALKLSPLAFVAVIINVILYVILNAAFGLFINLKFPNLNWINETAAVKSGISILFAMIFGLFYPVLLSALYLALKSFLSAIIFLFISIVLNATVCLLLFKYLKTKGCNIFENLNS